MNSVAVVGLGPGNLDYLTRKADLVLKEADIILGGSRHLEAVRHYGKEEFAIERRFPEMLELIRREAATQRIAIVVSGDTGFYSILRYLKKNIRDIPFEVIPGISSVTLLFARLGFMYDDAYIGSVHGRDLDLVKAACEYSKVGLLTDTKMTPAAIAVTLSEAGLERKMIAVGERLSYEDEQVTRMTLEDAKNYEADPLCVVVIYDEEVYI